MNDFPVGRSVDETLRLVKAFQFTDKHGEVCPVNWKPGSATVSTLIFHPAPSPQNPPPTHLQNNRLLTPTPQIKPDPVGKLEYFSKKK